MSQDLSREEFERILSEHSIQTAHAVEGVTSVAKAIGDLYEYRSPSRLSAIGRGHSGLSSWSSDGDAGGGYKAGSFLNALLGLTARAEPERAVSAKLQLEELGSRWSDLPVDSKATLGDTNASGGWIIPNAIVAPLTKPAPFGSIFRQLMSVVAGVTTPSVDLPWRSTAPAAATIAAFGATKENLNLAYDGYTVTMHTIARIYDLSKQFVRQSAGAAEQDVMSELASAFARAEVAYILSGTGSAQPYGIVTALQNAPGTFTTPHTAAATLAGSVTTAIAKAAGDLANRERTPTGALLNSATYWQVMVAAGADTAGYYLTGHDGARDIPGLPTGTLTAFGIPVFPVSQVPTDDLIVADFKAFRLLLGESFRVDTSDQAGDRWDKNLVGFRGEMELGFDARPAVFAGAAQYVTDVVP